MKELMNFPPQALSFKKKNDAWKHKVMDWADSKTFFNYSLVRKSIVHKKINYDLVEGKLHMNDLEVILNPDNLQTNYIPDNIQHYSIINSKLNVLRGEEAKRVFDYRVVVTNANDISEIENNKKAELLQRLQQLIQNTAQSEEEFNQELERLNEYYTYEWQDLKEIRANSLLNHYVKELEIPVLFNNGFMDAMIVGEEIYQCDIVGGEPTIERLNPLKLRCFKSGYSNRIEDADIIIYEDYWSPGKVYDTYYDVLSPKDREYLETAPDHFGQAVIDNMNNVDERYGFVNNNMLGEEFTASEGFFFDPFGVYGQYSNNLLPFDTIGNVRVLRVYWKSKRKIKKVKSYNQETGEEEFSFKPETYIINPDLGEEETIYYINEAWEGTKIGEDIYVNIRPRPIQYNRLSNPSRCHFGIVGSVYNLNEGKPFSLVDIMKPYAYLYDVVHDRLNKMIAKNWGKIIQLDFAKVPKGWDIDKWMYYAKVNNIAVIDSFKEGFGGAAQGKLAGGLNNASSGVIDADWGNNIQQYINLLEYIKSELSDVAGISKQREGQISNRETVGGVERATLQSSHITEWLFTIHDSVKKRALECFLETAKIAMRGRNKKFQYIVSDGSEQIMEIDGDLFSESDYGLVVDNSNTIQELNQKLDMLVQAGLQNQAINFSTAMKVYTSMSMADKIRMIQRNEQEIKQQQQQAQQQQQQQFEQQLQQQAQEAQMKFEQTDTINQRDNETKILVAEINAQTSLQNAQIAHQIPEDLGPSQLDMEKLNENKRQFDARLDLDKQRLAFDKDKSSRDQELKLKQINKSKTTSK